VAIQNASAAAFKVYDLVNCGGNSSDADPPVCPAHDYASFVGQQIEGLQAIRHVRFINDSLLSFEADSSTASNGGIYERAPTASITSLTDYLGLGDSYTSGEGALLPWAIVAIISLLLLLVLGFCLDCLERRFKRSKTRHPASLYIVKS